MWNQLEKKIVEIVVTHHHDNDTTLRNLSKMTGAPYPTVRRAVYRLEREGVVRILKLQNEYLVKIRNIARAWELGYLPPVYLTYGSGHVAPVVAYRNGFYLSDEAYITLPFRIKRHEAMDVLLDLEMKSRDVMEDSMSYIGEWPRFTALFYRTTLQPITDLFIQWARRNGLEPGDWMPPAYGFFAFLLYVVRKLTGLEWKDAYCKTLELVASYISETKAGDSPTEEFIQKILVEMRKWPCTK